MFSVNFWNLFGTALFSEHPLREKCSYLELFWSALSRIRTEYGEILRICSYSLRMRENTDQNNSKYGHFLCSDLRVTTSGLVLFSLSKLNSLTSEFCFSGSCLKMRSCMPHFVDIYMSPSLLFSSFSGEYEKPSSGKMVYLLFV